MTLSDIDWRPGPRKLREFAWSWLLGFGVIGLVVAWRTGALTGAGSWTWPLAIWTAAVAVGGLGIACPRAVSWIYRVWMALAFPIGWLISHIVLALTFFLLFAPVALWFRLIGRDSLQRRLAKEQSSYWIPLGKEPEPEQYYRQF